MVLDNAYEGCVVKIGRFTQSGNQQPPRETLRESPQKLTFLSLVFYDAPNSHAVDNAPFIRAGEPPPS